MTEMAGNGNCIMCKTCFLVLALAAGVSGWTRAAVAARPGSSEKTSAASADFYVASGGKDSNLGTADEPLATLAKARNLVRERVAVGLTHNILVLIRGGIYEQTTTLDFGPQDSGTERYSITYAAYPGEKVVLSGGRQISGWKKGQGDIWTTELPEVKAGEWYFRQLFVGGRRAVRARTPNAGWWKIKTSTAKKEPPPKDAAITLGVNHPIRAWKNIADVELVFLENNEGSRRRLGKVNEAEQTLTIPPPQQSIPRIFEYDWAISIPMAGKVCYFENAREMLDEPGQWYLDRQTGVLSYWPRPGEDLRHVEAVAPVVQKTLLSVAGTSTDPVKNLHFRGIYVEHVDWPLPPAGYYGVFGCLIITDGDKPIHKWMDAAVALEHARSCSFSNGGIAHVGGMGLCLLRGTSFDVIDGNEIYDLGGGGIGAGGIRNRSTLKWNPPPVPGDYQGYRITNNHIHDCGTAYFGAIGIFLAMTQDAVVGHNLVHDTAYTGIVICGNEDRQLPFARNNTVQYNHIHHVMKVAGDGSGIYLSFPQAGWGALIRGNLIHDLGRGHGVYLDGVFPRGVRNYRLEKNVMYGSDVFLHLCFEKDNAWVDNVFMKQGTPPQAVLESIRAEVGPRPSNNFGGLEFTVVSPNSASGMNSPNPPAGVSANTRNAPKVLRRRPDKPRMYFADTVSGRPFSKDPAVAKFKGRYWLYYSLPHYQGKPTPGWNIGVATSRNLVDWEQAGELANVGESERKGFCAPGAIVLGGKVHLFYQTYGNGRQDAICHAWSEDGLHFHRDPTNPIFRPTGDWNCGRAIDADVIPYKGQLLMYWATRDPAFKIQMQGVAAAPLESDFARDKWTQLNLDGPILKPELPWEGQCIEAAAMAEHGGRLYMFYGGNYNNQPQQIGVATSNDGLHFTRLSDKPFLPSGPPGAWNSSESGHPFMFRDDDGQHYLFYQGNNDHGRSWYLSVVPVDWREEKPVLAEDKLPRGR